MGRRIGSVIGYVLLVAVVVAVVAACAHQQPSGEAAPAATYPTSFSVSDPELDAESTAAGPTNPPNVDLTGISAAVDSRGLTARFTYAPGWSPHRTVRWGVRFEIRGSDGSRLSGGWTQDPASPVLTRVVQLAPRTAGCRGSVRFTRGERRLTLTLSRGCLPATSSQRPRPWIRFDTLEAVSSWHEKSQILYAWDHLYARLVAPEPERLYLPD